MYSKRLYSKHLQHIFFFQKKNDSKEQFCKYLTTNSLKIDVKTFIIATLKRKITVGKGHRNHAKKLLNDTDQNLDDCIKMKSVIINSLTEKHSLIKQLDNEILGLIESENDIEKGIESTSEFFDKLQIAFAKLENIFSEQNNNEKSSTAPTASLVANSKPKPSQV